MATPLYCRKCGVLLPAQSPFCPACGASQSGFDHSPTKASEELSDTGTGRLPPGRMLHDRYRLLQAVGQGGMGAVYVAQDTQLGDRLVAVKEMSMSRLTPQELPLAVEQFKREAHLLASLQHPHLPIIYEYFGAADRWYLVMSFIEGGTLQAYLNSTQGNKLSVNQVVRIGIELCDVHAPFIFFTSILLLLLGTRFFLRTAGVREGLIFGACLIIAGIIVSKIVQSSPLYNNGLTLAIPNIGPALWIPSVILGVAAILVVLVKRQRNMQSVQGQVS